MRQRASRHSYFAFGRAARGTRNAITGSSGKICSHAPQSNTKSVICILPDAPLLESGRIASLTQFHARSYSNARRVAPTSSLAIRLATLPTDTPLHRAVSMSRWWRAHDTVAWPDNNGRGRTLDARRSSSKVTAVATVGLRVGALVPPRPWPCWSPLGTSLLRYAALSGYPLARAVGGLR